MPTIAYHIVFTTYGTWLHGDQRGSVDKHLPGKQPPDLLLEERRRRQLKHPPVTLTPGMRSIVEDAIHGVSDHRGYCLRAVSVRTNHVHIAVNADDDPKRMLHAFKSYATRRLREDGHVSESTRVWTAKGVTKRIENAKALGVVVDYILNRQ